MTATVEKVLDIAKGEVGYHEGRAGGHWNNDTKYADQVPGLKWADKQAWCATFVAWVALKAGVADLYPSTASCDVAMAWFKERGRFSEYPAIGAQVFYGTPADSNHTGIVVDYDGTYITTVEGNTNTSGSREGDGVYLKKRERRQAYVVGYGYPEFPEGIVSADPAYSRERPKTTREPDHSTPNIAAFLTAKSRRDRIAALKAVAAHGSSKARGAAQVWLDADATARQAKRAKSAARKALKELEVR